MARHPLAPFGALEYAVPGACIKRGRGLGIDREDIDPEICQSGIDCVPAQATIGALEYPATISGGEKDGGGRRIDHQCFDVEYIGRSQAGIDGAPTPARVLSLKYARAADSVEGGGVPGIYR